MSASVRRTSRLRRALLVLVLCAVGSSAASAQLGAVIRGVVRDSAGHPVPGVDLGVAGAAVRTHSDDKGEYRIAGVIPGPATLVARRIGFKPHSQNIQLRGGLEYTVDITLVAAAEVLEAVNVTAPHQVYEARLAGFNARMQKKVGHFVTRERIDRANSTTLSDMLREIPGVKIGPMRNEGRAIRLRGSTCPPLVFVDGFPATAGEFDVDIIDLQSVEGIEVYAGLGTIPPEFTGPRELDRCGVIAIWSRPSRDRRQAAFRAEARMDSVRLSELSSALTHDEVDLAARLDTASPGPRYPDSLFRARVPGQVVVEFVVDSAGMVEAATIDVLASSHPLFTASVREALLSAHFYPAWAKGRRVRQFVQLPFSFVPDEESPKRPPE
ncbi:MAG: TonB family protein [bacterium]